MEEIIVATWISHLRIAENILKEYKLEEKWFVAGSVGPDSGVPNEDWSEFNPPSKITHWKNSENEIDSEAFYNKYLKDASYEGDRDRFSYLVGYYFHLLADKEWTEIIMNSKGILKYKERLKNEPEFIWTIKKDWYGLDFLYLRENPNSVFHRTFIKIKNVPDYLDYFPKSALENQMKYISSYYLGDKPDIDREFIYLSKENMDEYVSKATEAIEAIGKRKGILVQ